MFLPFLAEASVFSLLEMNKYHEQYYANQFENPAKSTKVFQAYYTYFTLSTPIVNRGHWNLPEILRVALSMGVFNPVIEIGEVAESSYVDFAQLQTIDSTTNNPTLKINPVSVDTTNKSIPVDTTKKDSTNVTKSDSTASNVNINFNPKTETEKQDSIRKAKLAAKQKAIEDSQKKTEKKEEVNYADSADIVTPHNIKIPIVLEQTGEFQNKWTMLKRPILMRDPYYIHEFGAEDIENPADFSNDIETDSNFRTYSSQEKYQDVDIAPSYSLSLNQYLEYRKNQIRDDIYDSLITRFDAQKALSRKDINSLLDAVSGMTIPVPPSPITSIFGKPEVNINVRGDVNIKLGLRYNSQNLGTTSQFGQSQWSPMFEQDVNLDVGASIGDKFKFNTNWNTRRVFDYDNTFKIGFEGEDDDIIKLVEVGNVSLPLTTSLINGGEALFGVRADFQFGPLYLKTLFSQRRGQRKFVDVTGGASKQYFSLRAYDYAKNHFFLDSVYKPIYDEYFEHSTPIIPKSSAKTRISKIEVYQSTSDVTDYVTRSANAIAYADLEPINYGEVYGKETKQSQVVEGYIEKANFMLMDSTQYRVDRNLGTVHIKNMHQDRFYAVAYSIENEVDAPEDDKFYGTFSSSISKEDTMILKLIYRPNLQPQFKTLWDRQMKNIYQINASNINTADTKIGLWYIRQTNDSVDVLEGVPDKLVTIFGVDQVNNGTGAAPPDGIFDLTGAYFDSYYGEITFPHTEPFGDGLREYFARDDIGNPGLALEYVFDDVYDTTYTAAARNTEKDRFRISGEVAGTSSNVISLNDFNLAPNSIKVTLDGVELREYQDYVVDYFSGRITIRNRRALLPNANLRIEYEKQDIFNISTKTLAGIRADYQFLKTRNAKGNVGATVMHYDQSAVIDRVTLGEEPVSNTMIGFDAGLTYDMPWITKAVDALPFYDTKAESSVNLKGEWAVMLPTPNKRRSEITSDEYAPVVYIDNFEGAQRYISLGLNPGQWSHASQPVDPRYWANDSIASTFRAKSMWWQYFLAKVDIQEVYPNNKSYMAGNQKLTPLHIDFDPTQRGIYNKNTEFLDSLNPNYDGIPFCRKGDNGERVWSGMMRLFSSFNTNFDDENIEYIEIMMNIDHWSSGYGEDEKTRMFIDIGQISEDVIPNRTADTEDGSTEANPTPNGIIDKGEDTGYDRLTSEEEREVYPFPLNLEKDPARDDYSFNFSKDVENQEMRDFLFYNNIEGNASLSESGQFPDQEMLNRNNGMNIVESNSYFTYEVDLEPNPITNSQIVGGSGNPGVHNWHLYRIPVRKPDSKTGTPSFSNIQYIRVRYQGGPFRASIAEWRLLGSYWQRISNLQNVDPNDSVLTVSFVNRWENSESPDYYTMPPGVSAPRQINNPDPTVDVQMNEQSMAIKVKNLPYGEERMATRVFRQLDVFNYKKMKFFVHGDGSMPDQISANNEPKAYYFLRFGIDSSNYYEYRRPITRGWQEVEIDLAELTSYKQIRDTSFVYDRQTFPVAGDEHAHFAIRGYPILTNVSFFGFGIANPEQNFPNELSTTMWVNELRLIDPEEAADWAAVGSADIKIADLGQINTSIQTKKPNFHQLEERFGDRLSTLNWTVTANASVEKLVPKQWSGLKLPVTYTHSEMMQTPEYQNANDVKLDEAAAAEEAQAYQRLLQAGVPEAEARKQAKDIKNNTIRQSQTFRIQDSWALTGVKLGIPIKHWLVDQTINQMTFGYSYSQQYLRSPIYEEQFNWMWKLNAAYSVNIPDVLSIKPFKLMGMDKDFPILGTYSKVKWILAPSALNASIDMTRRRQTEQSRFLDYPSPVLREFSAMKVAGFSWKFVEDGFLNPILDYSINTNATLVPIETDQFGRQVSDRDIFDRMFRNGLYLGQNNLHSQTVSLNIKPVLPDIGGANRHIDMTGAYDVTYNWSDPMQPNPKIANAAKNASWSKTISFNMGVKLSSISAGWFGPIRPLFTPREGSVSDAESPNVAKISPEEAAKRNALAGQPMYKRLLSATGIILRQIFFEWDNMNVTFAMTSNSTNPGVYGGTGLGNLWTLGNDLNSGTSWAYQMGLVSNPHGSFSRNGSLFNYRTDRGLRPLDGIFQDNFSEQNTFAISMPRPLWENATLELDFKSDIGYNRNQTVTTDDLGVPEFSSILATKTAKRSFLSFPTIFGWSPTGNDIPHIVEIFEGRKADIVADKTLDSMKKNQKIHEALSSSFYEGLRAFSLFKGQTGKFLPAPNWQIRWEGLETWDIWGEWVQKLSFEHGYKSDYSEQIEITDLGKTIQSQAVQFGFQPLIGLNFSLDEEKVKGIATGTVKWATQTSYTINSTAKSTISGNSSNEFTIQGSYTMQNFEFPLFGFVLKNDFEMSLLGTYKRNYSSTFDVLDESSYTGENENGRTLEGTTNVILEPRASYKIDNMVKASAFFRWEGTFNEGAANPGYNNFQLGVEIGIALDGGR